MRPSGATVTEEFAEGVLPGCQVVSLPEDMSVEEAVTYYENQPGVAFAQPNYLYSIDAVPNDPLYSLQWGLKNTGQATPHYPSGGTAGADITAEDGWDVTTGSDEVVIAVIDSGVDYLHEDLVAQMWDDGAGHCGYDCVNEDNDPMDDNGHGTHCAGIVAAAGNNGIGVTGVCWNAKIMAVKSGDAEGRLTSADEIEGITYAVSHGADILSCLWGGTSYDPALKTAIDNAGVLVVCAAGNDGTDNDATPHYPSSYASPNIISVASTAPDDSISGFSNYGATSVDVGAPGTDIYSTLPREAGMGSIRFSDDFSTATGWAVYDGTGSGSSEWYLTSSVYTSPPSSVAIGPYGNDWDQWLYTTDSISLVGLTDPLLQYQWWVDTEYGYDYACVGVSEDDVNYYFIGLSGNTGAFVEETFDLTDFGPEHRDYSGKNIWIAFRLVTDSSGTGNGMCVADVQVGQQGPLQSVYGYKSGTSMATPMVSGVAGLLLARNTSYSAADLKAAIMDTADPISALSGKCISGGRVNASAALGPVPEPPEPPVGLPSVTDISPSLGPNSGFAYITALSGLNFTSEMTVTLTRIGETAIPAEYVCCENKTHARCAFNGAGAAVGGWDVCVTTASGTATLPAGFTIVSDATAKETMPIPVKTGWNMISAPLQSPAVDLTDTTPGTLYRYDPIHAMYVDCDASEIIPGRGYWVSAPSTGAVNVTGYPCPTYEYHVQTGWNLIGSIQTPVVTGSISLIPSGLTLAGPVYGYDTGMGQYVETTTLTPGKAYWMAFSGDGVMTVG